MNVKLKFINESNDTNNTQVVIFQKNVATDFDEHAVAWQVIENCGQGEYHPFTYPEVLQVSASDSFGNYTQLLDAKHGQAFTHSRLTSGDHLACSGMASNPAEIEVINGLDIGAIGANIFKDGKLLATQGSLAPQQAAVFQFRPTIWIGVASEISEGHVMDAAVMSTVNTELSLLGLASADIVMTGGGAGPDATPFTFSLQNVVMA